MTLGNPDSGKRQAVFAVIPGYKDSQEAAIRRLVREAIKKSKFSKSERDVALAIANLWFYHKNGPKGYIHPGREFLAKRARVSVRTVCTTLGKLRAAGVLVVIANQRGQGQRPTYYKVDLKALLVICGCKVPEVLEGQLGPIFGGPNCAPLSPEIAHHWRAEIAHSITNEQTFPSQPEKLGGAS